MIARPYHLKKLIQARDNGFPKVITGIRRCGKSFLLKEMYKQYLLDNGVQEENIIIIELDDLRNAKYRNPFELDKRVRALCNPNKKNYVILDEIQLLDRVINPVYTDGKVVLAKEGDENAISFVDLVLGLSREKFIDLYVTGSNSKMLSSDIVTEFRDKATIIQLRPLSFEEFCNYKDSTSVETVYEYLQYGGMPLAVLKEGADKQTYLKELFYTTYFKDIIERHRLAKSEALEGLTNALSCSCGQLLNAEKLTRIYESATKSKVGRDLVSNYISYFVDAFILEEAKRFDVKGNREIGAQRKYYFTDNGLRNARLNFAFDDEGQMLENMVYNELIYNGYNVNVGCFDCVEKSAERLSVKKTYEIDFLARRGPRQFYIQVCSDMASPETRAREIKPYIALNDQIQKIIVVNRPIKENLDSNNFTVIGVVDFLLRLIK